MFLLDNWATIRCIKDPDSTNTQQFAFIVPYFDEEKFPFIAVCGLKNLSLFNVRECTCEILMNQSMSVGQPGLQGAFAKTEEYGLSFHFTNEVTDKEDTGNDLIQYSFISLKEDALHWLRENGRLPSVDIDDYFEEIKEMNESRREIKRLEEKNKALQE